ncbi:MAG TPA: histidine phosphatase family protein [Candidatus Nanoarchaeia archaeon]|nr:histidine phosphatase family protein [Candidatus Nanoarchaeia archaeon]
MRIIICRHGETKANLDRRLLGRTDEPLNETGLQQAETLAKYLAQYTFTSIYSASLSRSRQTAETINKFQENAKIVLVPEFNERDYGSCEMKRWKSVFEEIPDLRERWRNEGENFRFPDGELLSDFITRVQITFRKTILENDLQQDIAYIAHGGSIKAMMGYMLGTDWTCIPNLCKQDHCAINIFSYDRNRFKAHLINYTNYKWEVT